MVGNTSNGQTNQWYISIQSSYIVHCTLYLTQHFQWLQKLSRLYFVYNTNTNSVRTYYNLSQYRSSCWNTHTHTHTPLNTVLDDIFYWYYKFKFGQLSMNTRVNFTTRVVDVRNINFHRSRVPPCAAIEVKRLSYPIPRGITGTIYHIYANMYRCIEIR